MCPALKLVNQNKRLVPGQLPARLTVPYQLSVLHHCLHYVHKPRATYYGQTPSTKSRFNACNKLQNILSIDYKLTRGRIE